MLFMGSWPVQTIQIQYGQACTFSNVFIMLHCIDGGANNYIPVYIATIYIHTTSRSLTKISLYNYVYAGYVSILGSNTQYIIVTT